MAGFRSSWLRTPARALAALALAGCTLALAGDQSSSDYRQPASVLACGGGPGAAPDFLESASVIGQPTLGAVSASEDYRNAEGFLQPLGEIAAGTDVWSIR